LSSQPKKDISQIGTPLPQNREDHQLPVTLPLVRIENTLFGLWEQVATVDGEHVKTIGRSAVQPFVFFFSLDAKGSNPSLAAYELNLTPLLQDILRYIEFTEGKRDGSDQANDGAGTQDDADRNAPVNPGPPASAEGRSGRDDQADEE
jgi:hypothetical protein